MSIITCQCGQQLQMSGAQPQGNLACPACGRVVATMGYGAQPQPAYAPAPASYTTTGYGTAYSPKPQESNNDAVIGFVLALASFLTCLVFAPVAVFFSLRGIKKQENQGFAIAGLLIGIIQSIALLGVVAYFAFVFVVVGGIGAMGVVATSQAARVAKQRVETETAINACHATIDAYHDEHEELPDAAEGNRLIATAEDAWGEPLKYSPHGETRWTITSAGPDQKFDTRDDIASDWLANNPTPPVFAEQPLGGFRDLELPTLPGDASIASVDDALRVLEKASPFDRAAGLEYLAEATPDDQHHDAVIQAAMGLLTDIHNDDDAIEVLAQWTTSNDDALLAEQFRDMSSINFSRYGRSLLQILVKHKAAEQLVSLVTHPESSIAREASSAAQSAGATDDQIARHCIDALLRPKEAQAAVELLKRTTPNESLRSKLNQNIAQELSQTSSFRRRDAVDVLKRWGVTQDSLPALAKAGELELVASVRGPETLKLLGEAFVDFPLNHSKAQRALKKIGPAGESCVWPALKGNQVPVVLNACQLLGEIGTAESIPHLQPLLESPVYRGNAQLAIRRIQQAKRQPARTW